ncbi:MAG: hypothetical protein HY812_17680 [Planctomycetes bacterium]|nr:hypothetical protein [Planctomycetota bacterium]
MNDQELRERLLVLHERIRQRTLAALASGALASGLDPAAGEAAVLAEGAGDVSYAIDVPAEEEIDRFARELDEEEPLVVVSEGLGERRYGAKDGAARLRLVVDPIDGTRNLAHDMRSGWILTAAARERGAATSLADVHLAVQSEIPTRDRRSFHVLSARRGAGARIERRDLTSGALLEQGPLRASSDPQLGNGFYVFFKFSPEDRAVIARIEEDFLGCLVERHGVDRRTLCDDQYISNAGQLFLIATRRYRFLADLRGHVGDVLGVNNFTSKPYDVCCALIAAEAGVPLTDERGNALDAPLCVDHRVSFVAYANEPVRRALEPLLQEALERFRAGAARRRG